MLPRYQMTLIQLSLFRQVKTFLLTSLIILFSDINQNDYQWWRFRLLKVVIVEAEHSQVHSTSSYQECETQCYTCCVSAILVACLWTLTVRATFFCCCCSCVWQAAAVTAWWSCSKSKTIVQPSSGTSWLWPGLVRSSRPSQVKTLDTRHTHTIKLNIF